MDNMSNWLDLGLNKEQERLVQEGAALYRATYLDTIDNVFKIAKAIEVLRTRNYGTGVKGGFAEALVQYGFTARDGGPMNKALISHFKALLENEDEVRTWWKGVPERKSRYWVSVKAIYNNWQASKKPNKPKPSTRWGQPSTHSQARGGVADSDVAALQARIRELEAKPGSGRKLEARIHELERELTKANMQLKMTQDDLACAVQAGAPNMLVEALRHEITALKGQVAHWKGQAKPKIESEEIAKRDERNGKLRVQIKMLGAVLNDVRRANPVTITKADHRKLSKIFHPDSGKHASETQLNEAIQIFNGLRFHVTEE